MRRANTQPLGPKKRCRRAFDLARAADPRSTVLFQRQYSEVLLAAEGQPADVRAEIFRRAAIGFEIAADRVSWPDSVIAALTPAPKARGRRAARHAGARNAVAV